MFYDPTFLLLIPAIILAIYAQFKVKGTYAKYSQVQASSGITGAQLARELLSKGGIGEVAVESIPGDLSDHYDPRDKKLRLSETNYSDHSVAALGVVAHEVGHALQDAKNYAPLKIRNNFVPVASFGSNLAMPMFFIGLLMSYGPLMDLGIIAFSLAVAFQLITLPVEFNASKRALALLGDGRYLNQEELPMAKQVLNAAALTYVAATAMAVLNLIRLIALRSSRED
ncbi:MAG: zinc metallopeptidase [Candidatus Saganbacteria bacterium]|nr:zinc metallopeptidase [Candidatus Saganbacteria bacterium]